MEGRWLGCALYDVRTWSGVRDLCRYLLCFICEVMERTAQSGSGLVGGSFSFECLRN